MEELIELIEQAGKQRSWVAEQLTGLDESRLNQKARADQWSALECLEHLNRYANYYLPELARALEKSQGSNFQKQIRYTWLGKKSIEMVRPTNKKVQKTLKRMNPAQSRLDSKVVTEFLTHQDTLLSLMKKGGKLDLNQKHVRVEFFKLIRLRSLEAFIFVVQHQERHLLQAKRAIKN